MVTSVFYNQGLVYEAVVLNFLLIIILIIYILLLHHGVRDGSVARLSARAHYIVGDGGGRWRAVEEVALLCRI